MLLLRFAMPATARTSCAVEPSGAPIPQLSNGVRRRARMAIGAYLAASARLTLWLLPAARERPPSFEAPRSERSWPVDPEHAVAIRDLALRQARVWQPAHARARPLPPK